MTFTKSVYTVSLLIVGFGLAVNGYSQSFLTNGLVAYYPFNGNANDASGSGNTGIVYDATLTADRFGSPSSAYDFNGTNSYIDIPQNSVLNSLTTNFTLSAWIWARVITLGHEILSKQSAGYSDSWEFDTIVGCTPNFYQLRLQGAVPGGCNNVMGVTEYSLMKWHHVVATVSGTVAQLYLDGVLDGTGNVGNIPANTLDIFIGSGHASPRSSFLALFNGMIDDVRIYNRALSSNEVAQLYAIEAAPVLNVRKAVYLDSFSLMVSSNYQVQVSSDMTTWTNYGAQFTATNSTWRTTNYWDVDNWNQLFFRLQVLP